MEPTFIQIKTRFQYKPLHKSKFLILSNVELDRKRIAERIIVEERARIPLFPVVTNKSYSLESCCVTPRVKESKPVIWLTAKHCLSLPAAISYFKKFLPAVVVHSPQDTQVERVKWVTVNIQCVIMNAECEVKYGTLSFSSLTSTVISSPLFRDEPPLTFTKTKNR